MIQIENLKKVYNNGYEALKSINLEINDGELIRTKWLWENYNP